MPLTECGICTEVPPIFLAPALGGRSPFIPLGGALSEDCLSMNVRRCLQIIANILSPTYANFIQIFRPANLPKGDKIPVLVWPFVSKFHRYTFTASDKPRSLEDFFGDVSFLLSQVPRKV